MVKKLINLISLVFIWHVTILAHPMINSAIDSIDPHVNLGVRIRNLNNGKVIYERNAERYYNFASVMKLVTFSSIYDLYEKNHKFYNLIYKHGDNFYLDVGDDPNFSDKDLENLTIKLKKRGINSIKGNFYIINKEFGLPPVNPARMLEDNSFCYGAPITRVHINKNCLKIFVLPAKKIGDNAIIKTEFGTTYKIVNKVKTVKNADKAKVSATIIADKIVVEGAINCSSGAFTAQVLPQDNILNLALYLKKNLKKSQIILHGNIKSVNKLPKEAIKLAENGKGFDEVASYALQYSDNFITDYLFAKLHSSHDDWAEAGVSFRNHIGNKFAVDLSKSLIVDGSGLSRHNIFTVAQIDQILKQIYLKHNFQQFCNLLCNNGNLRGTLQHRFPKVKIFAKTGSVMGVSAIVGYAYDDNNTPYSVVIVANGFFGKKIKYEKLEEKIIRIVLDSHENNS